MSGAGTVTPAGYVRWRATTLGRITERTEMNVVLDLAGPLRGQRVLDVGTGDGTYAIEAAARGARAAGIDIDPAMLETARARAAARAVAIDFRVAHATALPFADGAFDLVMAVTVLCLLAEPEAVLTEIARVLAPGGRLVLGELGRYSAWAAARRVKGWLGNRIWRGARFWSRRELAELVESPGLRTTAVRGAVFFPPNELAARALARFDGLLARAHAPGAAFIAVRAERPATGPARDHAART
jgi:SAM-dependent methyltransferase